MKKFYIYEHHVIDADVRYVGVTTNPKKRFMNANYKGKSLYKYLDISVPLAKNKNIETTILYCVNNKKTALSLEDRFIVEMNTINIRRSGHISSDKNRYYKEKYKEHPEVYQTKKAEWRNNHLEESRTIGRKCRELHRDARIEQTKKWRSTPQGRINTRVRSFNNRHPDKAVVTPSEAVEMFELTGWVPTFVKHDDLLHTDTVVQR